jgi:hypothetical protein
MYIKQTNLGTDLTNLGVDFLAFRIYNLTRKSTQESKK